MASTLRIGTTSKEVRTLQKLLAEALDDQSIEVDGIFGPKTEAKVESFQLRNNLYVDGVVGRQTWRGLVAETAVFLTDPVKRIDMDKFNDGYASTQLRKSTATKVEAARREVNSAGGILTSSGGMRSLWARVSPTRSATSFHYTGRAFDLFVYSGMVDPHTDPYVIVKDPDRYWRVYARITDECFPIITLKGYTYDHEEVETEGRFLDLTRILETKGFARIRARRSFFTGRGGNMAAEWWHFQDMQGLEPEESFFGHEVAKVWSRDALSNTRVWRDRDYLLGVDWF